MNGVIIPDNCMSCSSPNTEILSIQYQGVQYGGDYKLELDIKAHCSNCGCEYEYFKEIE